MRWTLAAIATLAGCGEVFGIHTIDPAAESPVQLVEDRAFVTATVTTRTTDLTAIGVVALIADDTMPGGFRTFAMPPDARGTPSAMVPDGAQPIVRYQLPGEPARLIAIGARAIHERLVQIRRADVAPAPVNAQVALSASLVDAYDGDAFTMIVVGAWAAYAPPDLPALGATSWAPMPFAYRDFKPVVPLGSAGPDRITPDDLVFVERYDTTSTGIRLSGLAATPGFVQHDGVDAVADTVATIPLDRTFDYELADPIAPRLAVVRSAPSSRFWQITAAPGGAVGATTGPTLLYANVAGADQGTGTFGDPFVDRAWPETLIVVGNALRTYVTSNASVSLAAQIVAVATPGPAVVPVVAPLPILISLAGTPLVTDDLSIALDPSRGVELAMTLDRPQPCDLYDFSLEAIDRLTGVRTPQAFVTTDRPVLVVPADLFAAGTTYTIRAICFVGVPGIADGDFAIAVPYGQSFLDSAPFTIHP